MQKLIVSRMIRRLLLTTFTIALLGMVSVSAGAAMLYVPEEMSAQQDQEIVIQYSEGILYVTGAENQQMDVVALTGKKVMSVKIESPAQKIELNIPKGCYIVKIGDVVRKISVK